MVRIEGGSIATVLRRTELGGGYSGVGGTGHMVISGAGSRLIQGGGVSGRHMIVGIAGTGSLLIEDGGVLEMNDTAAFTDADVIIGNTGG